MLVIIPSLRWQRGGEKMNIVITIIVSVMADVVSYYICKWLDRNDKDD